MLRHVCCCKQGCARDALCVQARQPSTSHQTMPCDAHTTAPGHTTDATGMHCRTCIASTCAMLSETAHQLHCTALQLPQAWLRVALGYHTVAQVAVGWVVGGGSAAAWHAWGRRVALPAVRQSLQLQVSGALP